MDKLYSHGPIEKYGPLAESDWDLFESFKTTMPAYVKDDIKPIGKSEGWLSTGEVDRANDIIEPTAWTEYIPTFMKNPALMFNHDWTKLPVGIWTDMVVVPGKVLSEGELNHKITLVAFNISEGARKKLHGKADLMSFDELAKKVPAKMKVIT